MIYENTNNRNYDIRIKSWLNDVIITRYVKTNIIHVIMDNYCNKPLHTCDFQIYDLKSNLIVQSVKCYENFHES